MMGPQLGITSKEVKQTATIGWYSKKVELGHMMLWPVRVEDHLQQVLDGLINEQNMVYLTLKILDLLKWIKSTYLTAAVTATQAHQMTTTMSVATISEAMTLCSRSFQN
jgi:hypothetical protein